MAYDKSNFPRLGALEALAEKVEQDYAKKSDLTEISTAAAAAFKSGEVNGNTIKLYTSADKSGAAALTIDFPTEFFLDQSKTKFVPAFAFSAETYPGATDPELDGKPVMVLAVKGSDDSVNYSFASMAQLVDTYTAKNTGKDPSTTVTVDGYEIEVKVNVSAEADNQIQVKADGLFVPKPKEADTTGKADKVAGATAGDLAALDASGNLTDSGKKITDFSKVEASTTAGKIKVDGQEVTIIGVASDAEVTEMLNTVFGSAT